MATERLQVNEDFAYLTSFLPQGWQAKARQLGALRRCRKVPDAETLLRVLLIHLAEGCSLRETAVRARQGHLAALSDVAIMDRLKRAGEWFRWTNRELMKSWIVPQPEAVFGSRWNVRVIDGTRIKEPGPTGSSWCVHYSIGLPSLACQEWIVSEPHGEGESFKLFHVNAGDLFLGDRAYGVRPGIFHVCRHGGDVLVRFALSNLPLLTRSGRGFSLLNRLRTLTGTCCGDWPVLVRDPSNEVPGRICALRKSRQAAEQARKQVIRQAQKQGTAVQPETLEAAGYIFVFTTVAAEQLGTLPVLRMYGGRWQIELVFKRLKSILEVGHLRKTDTDAAKAWLHGKLLVAFLVETLIRCGETFFPWGWLLPETPQT